MQLLHSYLLLPSVQQKEGKRAAGAQEPCSYASLPEKRSRSEQKLSKVLGEMNRRSKRRKPEGEDTPPGTGLAAWIYTNRFLRRDWTFKRSLTAVGRTRTRGFHAADRVQVVKADVLIHSRRLIQSHVVLFFF